MTTQTTPRPAEQAVHPGATDVGLARTTGLLYLALAITGGVGNMLIRPALFEPGDAAATLANLADNPGLARLGIALEMGIVVTQTLVALWFFRLFRHVDAFAAGSIAVFGLINAVAILASAAFLATALDVALEPLGDAATAHLLYLVSSNLWGVGGLFFGLWLLPMGWCVLRSRSMPRALGWLLVAGGVAYVLGAFLRYLLPDAGALVDLAAVPATIGEVWMVGALLLRGVGSRAPGDKPAPVLSR